MTAVNKPFARIAEHGCATLNRPMTVRLADQIRLYRDVADFNWDDDLAVIRDYASILGEPIFLDPSELKRVITQCETLDDFDNSMDEAIRNER